MEDPALTDARAIAESIVRRLDVDDAQWSVIAVDWAPEAPADLVFASRQAGTSGVLARPVRSQIAVTFGNPAVAEETVTAHYPLVVPRPDATVELASQMQDLVVEFLAWGVPVPPCPGHAHALDPVVVDGTAVWRCPKVPDHYGEPILT